MGWLIDKKDIVIVEVSQMPHKGVNYSLYSIPFPQTKARTSNTLSCCKLPLGGSNFANCWWDISVKEKYENNLYDKGTSIL